MIIENNKITAEEGMTLTNGDIYSDCIYLGIYDNVNNWREIPISEILEPLSELELELKEKEDYFHAARILMGME